MFERSPFFQLLFARLREWKREPEVLFWVFGFPVLLAVGLGIAFRNKPADETAVGVVEGPGAAEVAAALPDSAGFRVHVTSSEEASQRLRLGKIAIVVVPGTPRE